MIRKIIAMPRPVRLGGNTWMEPTAKSVLVTPYGDAGAEYAAREMDAAGASHPREANLAGHRMVAVSGRWGKPLAYSYVTMTLGRVAYLLEKNGWQIAPSLEGVHGTGREVFDLATVAEYPDQAGVGGFNAAQGFSLEAEMPELAPSWSRKDLTEAAALAQEVYNLL